jgi:hypothetical protein
MELFT